MATEYAMNIDQGSDYRLVVDVLSDWLTDLTGYSARWAVRSNKNDANVLADLTNYVTVDTVNQQLVILVPAAVSSAWTWTYGLYDIEVYNSVPRVGRVLQGMITVDREVTRP